MFRLQAIPKSIILFSHIIFVASSVAPAGAQNSGSPKQTIRANNVATPSSNAAAKRPNQGYVSTSTRMGCKMGGNCQR
jgi:hypothetical protein